MSKKTTREPVHIEHPDNLADPKKRKQFVDKVTASILDAVDAERARMGKSPLKD